MIVLTVGTFDIPHRGHYELLKRCSEIGSVFVGINTDDFVKKYKGQFPVLPYHERATTIKSWGYETLPNTQSDGTIKPLIKESRANLIAIGSDWLRKPYLEQIGLEVEYLERHNIGLLYLPYTPHISTTQIKERVRSQL